MAKMLCQFRPLMLAFYDLRLYAIDLVLPIVFVFYTLAALSSHSLKGNGNSRTVF